jgi:hypothetical protein
MMSWQEKTAFVTHSLFQRLTNELFRGGYRYEPEKI